MRGGIHHIDLTVKDAHASRAFYESVLGFMGYKLADAHPNGYDFDLRDGDTFCSIGILSARGAHADHAHLQSIGANITDPPADYPKYGLGYYAVFFTDADGLKLEYVFKPLAP